MDTREAVLTRAVGAFAARRLLADARARLVAGATDAEVEALLFWRVVALIDPEDLVARRPRDGRPRG